MTRNYDDEFSGLATMPDGRLVRVFDCGTTESDTGAFISSPGYPVFEDEDTEEIIEGDDLNELVAPNYYFHEWACEKVVWD